MEHGTVCHRNMDVEEGGHSTTAIVWNVDLEKGNENQLDWTPIQSRFWTMAHENRSLMNTIQQRQKNWLGHVLRSESILHTVLEGRMEGTRTRGRHSDTMIDWMKSNDMEYEHIKKELITEKTAEHSRQIMTVLIQSVDRYTIHNYTVPPPKKNHVTTSSTVSSTRTPYTNIIGTLITKTVGHQQVFLFSHLTCLRQLIYLGKP